MDSLPSRRSGGCALSLGIGAFTTILVRLVFSGITGQPLNLADEWDSYILQLLLVALPFGLLALAKIRDGRAWLVGLILTTGFWGYYLFAGLRYQLSGDRSGVDFSLIFLMLLSPLIITAACFIAAVALKKRS